MAEHDRRRTPSKRFQTSANSKWGIPVQRVKTVMQAAVDRPPDPAAVEQVRSLTRAALRLWGKLESQPEALAHENQQHSDQVATLGLKIARLMGLEEDQAMRVFRAGYLHDVGAAAVPDFIVVKSGALTPEERLRMQVHPLVGCELLRLFLPTDDLSAIALSHHERFDGGGYPNALHGTRIPLEARVLAIADSLDAMLSPRPYRHPLPLSAAWEELTRGAGRQFDPSIVEDLVWKGRSVAWGLE